MAAGQQNFSLSLSDLLNEVLPSSLPAASAAIRVEGVTLDSRNIRQGDVFLACPGANHDGRDFIAHALSAGACAVLVEAEGFVSVSWSGERGDEPVIPVPLLSSRASAIAGRFYGHPSRAMTVTGITGTNGKTTCTQLLAQLYALLGSKAGVLGTLGAGLLSGELSSELGGKLPGDGSACDDASAPNMTTADAVSNQALLASFCDAGANYVAMEVSSHGLVQNRVADVCFDTAVFTNLSRDHLDYHGDMATYLAAKAQLFHSANLKRAVINSDDPAGKELAAQLSPAVECFRFGLAGDEGIDDGIEVRAENYRYTREGITANLVTPWGQGELRSGLVGEFNVSNLLAVVTVACAQGFDLQEVLSVIPKLQPVAGRMQSIAGSDLQVVVDYAHTPDALQQAIKALRLHCEGELWCVFGCGGDRDEGKRQEMGGVANRYADRVVVTSDNPRSESSAAIINDILRGVPDEQDVLVEADRRVAIRMAISQASAGDTVLIAGKGHENYQEVEGVRWPFSDVSEASQALGERALAQAGGGQ